MGNRDCISAGAEPERGATGCDLEPEDTAVACQVRVVRKELARFAERSWFALGGEMTPALRENLWDNCSDWADDMARHIAKFLVEYRLRQLGLDGDEERCGGWSAYDDLDDADDPE